MKLETAERAFVGGMEEEALSYDHSVTNKTLSFLIISGFPIFAVGLEAVISKSFKARISRMEKVRAGLELCGTEGFDVVLLGVTQPERSGLDLLLILTSVARKAAFSLSVFWPKRILRLELSRLALPATF